MDLDIMHIYMHSKNNAFRNAKTIYNFKTRENEYYLLLNVLAKLL
jgi:hypothetical protein